MFLVSLAVFDRDTAGLLVFVCARADTERSRPCRFDGEAGALREEEGAVDKVIVEFDCVTCTGCWKRFGGPGAGRYWPPVKSIAEIKELERKNEQVHRNFRP